MNLKVLIILYIIFQSAVFSQKLLINNYYVSYSDTHTGSMEHDINVGNTAGNLDSLNLVLTGTHPRIPKPGSYDKISFKKGERFFGQINLNDSVSNKLTFGSYGTGEKPIIDGSFEHFWFNKNDISTYDSSYTLGSTTFYTKYISNIDSIIVLYADETEQVQARYPNLNEGDSCDGFNRIDAVDASYPNLKFTDNSNSSNWVGGDVVTKTQNWRCEIRKIVSGGSNFELKDTTSWDLRTNWGYFIQNHISALDVEKEWYFDRSNNTLHFSPEQDSCYIYPVTNLISSSGFVLKSKEDIKIENLSFRNHFSGILFKDPPSGTYTSNNITINDNTITNSIYGIRSYFNTHYVNNSVISNNYIHDIVSRGIIISKANNCELINDTLSCIGLTYSYDQGISLNGIELYGDSLNVIQNNYISDVGYCGIKFSGGNCLIDNNNITNAMTRLGDGGAIYSWHNLVDSTTTISNNIINGSLGCNAGTPYGATSYHACGIYLDELSLNNYVSANDITNCGTGIYIQNSRSNIITLNDSYGNFNSQFTMNHGTSILNGGSHNPNNTISFDPSTGFSSYWNNSWKTLHSTSVTSSKSNIVYVQLGDNHIFENNFTPDNSSYTMLFRTWQEVNDSTLFDLTSNSDPVSDNLADGYTSNDAIVLISYSDVNDNSVTKMVGKSQFANTSNITFMKSLKKFRIEGITGTKTYK